MRRRRKSLRDGTARITIQCEELADREALKVDDSCVRPKQLLVARGRRSFSDGS
jgi:hypothetical protein